MGEVMWKGSPSLRTLLVSLADLDEDPRNVRLHPQSNLDAIGMSYRTFGQVKPIVSWRPAPGARLIALAGNGTIRKLRAMGWTHVAAAEFIGSEVNARAYAITDNQVPLMAEWDEPALAAEMAWIQQEFRPATDFGADVGASAADFTDPPEWQGEDVPAPPKPPKEERPPTDAAANTRKALIDFITVYIGQLAPGCSCNEGGSLMGEDVPELVDALLTNRLWKRGGLS